MQKIQQFLFLCVALLGFLPLSAFAYTQSTYREKEEAIRFVLTTNYEKSKYWPEVNPQSFSANLIKNIEDPIYLNAGRNTNFCGFAAISYYFILEDPLGYAKFMTKLYTEGKANYGKAFFTPSASVRNEAGKIIYEGDLDQNDADQVLFFTMADHFKGYLNLFHHRYRSGAEQTIWASTNLSKFNRMLRQMLNREVHSIGSDLIQPDLIDLPEFLQEKLLDHDVFLYLNNTILRKKNHLKLRKRIPTHFVVLISIFTENETTTLTYWDAGFKTRRLIATSTLDKIVYGISWTKKKQ